MNRRTFTATIVGGLMQPVLELAAAGDETPLPSGGGVRERAAAAPRARARAGRPLTVMLTGDVMTGRGIDQILPHSCDPRIHEPYLSSAIGYLELAEAENGPIPKPVDFSYPWGDALAVRWQKRASETAGRRPASRTSGFITNASSTRLTTPSPSGSSKSPAIG